jgi:hypothetical protein
LARVAFAVELTLPKACESVTVAPAKLTPASPPALKPKPVTVTLPLAHEDVIVPGNPPPSPFCPTSPPTKLIALPLTAPVAEENEIVP